MTTPSKAASETNRFDVLPTALGFEVIDRDGRTDVTNVVYVDSVQGAEVRYTRKGITGRSFLRLFNETFRKVNIHDV